MAADKPKLSPAEFLAELKGKSGDRANDRAAERSNDRPNDQAGQQAGAADPFDDFDIDFDDLNEPASAEHADGDGQESEGGAADEAAASAIALAVATMGEDDSPEFLDEADSEAEGGEAEDGEAEDGESIDSRDGALGSKSGDRVIASTPDVARGQKNLSELFARVNDLLGGLQGDVDAPFRPRAPEALEETGLTFEEVERLILKFLLSKGAATGRTICAQICLSFQIVDPILKQLKHEQLLAFKGAAEMGDYQFTITDYGRERARRYNQECSYYGAAPVQLSDYLKAMAAQSVADQEATEADLHRAFQDLILNKSILERLGPAVNSGRGLFLFGEPGNGKTSIAERITRCFGSTIWIPRALGIDGDIIRVFDPGLHEVVTEQREDGLFDLSGVDPRWVQIVRPTVIAGGELTMAMLEVCQNPTTKICEAPLQLKSNCGTLVIDDFGRQTMAVDELLNRWIVPLEKRYDFLNLPSGKKVQVPFDQLIIFSTNLEPKDLVDGAFLRRIPYKIEVPDPSREEFVALMKLMSPIMGFEYEAGPVEHLVKTHYEEVGRPFRCCQPRDLLLQVKNYCVYKSIPKKLSNQAFDFAVENYFSVM